MNIYEIKTAEFQGPMDKLLELIEEKQLPITKVNIAEVTADFLEYIKKIGSVHPKILAVFIAVASRLILIKSHNLLPNIEISEEEEGEITDLELSLKHFL